MKQTIRIGGRAGGIAALLAAAITIGTAAGVSAAGVSFTPEQAEAIAVKQTPEGSIHLKTTLDEYKYEIEYYNEDKNERYDIDVSLHTQKILKYDSERVDKTGSPTVTLKEEDAKNAVLKEFPKAEISSVVLETDDGLSKYKVFFSTDTLFGSYEIHPKSGLILERELNVGAKAPDAKTGPAGQQAAGDNGLIPLEKAKAIAQAKAPDAALVECRLDIDDGYPRYEGKLRSGRWEYEFEIDAKTGNIIEWEVDYDD